MGHPGHDFMSCPRAYSQGYNTCETHGGLFSKEAHFQSGLLFRSIQSLQYCVTPTGAGDCGTYTAYGGHCYNLPSGTRTWIDAQTHCRSEGAEMVEIEDIWEQNFVEG